MKKYPERDELIKEYDDYYTADPNKWANDKRNEFMLACLRECYFEKSILSIIDVGCGMGHTLSYLGKKTNTIRLYGIDLSPVACELARKNTGAEIFCGFIDDYEVSVKHDIALCMGVAEHFENPVEGLNKIREVANYLYLEVPHNLSYSEDKTEGYRRLEVGSRQLEWHLKRSTWRDIITQAGWEVVKEYKGKKPAWEFVWMLKG